MKRYKNFYETLKEARDRLVGTVVLYDGEPYGILAITDHTDGIFRSWCQPLSGSGDDLVAIKSYRNIISHYGNDHFSLEGELNKLIEKYPNGPVIRKYMNSPKFGNFRPFPLGMCNVGTRCYYVERQPIRPSMHQGLTKSGIWETLITAGSRSDAPRQRNECVEIYSRAFRDCIVGDYHTAHEVLEALNNPNVLNDSHAFNREFALCRGPIDLLFLAYRSDIIGVLPNKDFSLLKLGRDFRYTREAVEELGLFTTIS